MRRKRLWIITLLLALTCLYEGPIPVAHAATITVNTTDDELNNNGNCSLREAIQAANTDTAVDGCAAGNGGDTITLPAGIYTLTIPGADEENNATGDLDIRDDLTINGDGAGSTIIRAGTNSTNGIDRVLDVHASATVEINDVAILFGRTPDIYGEQDGGGIRNHYGMLTLNNSIVYFNTADDFGGGIRTQYGTLTLNNSSVFFNTANASGGGIYSYAGTLTLDNSSVSYNMASGVYSNGGGIYSYAGTLTLDNCTVRGNDADRHGGGIFRHGGRLTLDNCTVRDNEAGGNGGGIYSGISTYSTLRLNNCTVSGNDASGDGGGIYSYEDTLTLDNCTVSGNDADGNGGGVYGYHGTLTLNNSTIAHNTADRDNNGFGDGGGVAVPSTATANVMNTIIGDNQDRSGQAPDCSGTLASQGYNLVEEYTSGCTFIPTEDDVTGSDPNLGALADNGGPTYTHALLTGSPAIEQILDGINGCQAGVSADQRGYVRAGGGPDNGGSRCEIGAYEYDTVTLAPPTGPVYLPIILKNH